MTIVIKGESMRKQLLLTGLAAGLIAFQTCAADAQPSVLRQRSTNPGDTQMHFDPVQLTPEGQIATMSQNMNQLMRQNQQLKAELDSTKEQLDQMQRRLESIGNILITGTGESIGSMVHKIRDKVGASD